MKQEKPGKPVVAPRYAIMSRRQAVRAARTWRNMLAAAANAESLGGVNARNVGRWFREEARHTKTALDGYIARGGEL